MKSRFLILAVFCALDFWAAANRICPEIRRPDRTVDRPAARRHVLKTRLDAPFVEQRHQSDRKLRADKDKKANADDPVVRLKGLEKEVCVVKLGSK